MKKLITLCLTLVMALAGTAEEWTLLTDASDLQAGDQIVLACSSKGKVATTTLVSASARYMLGEDATFGDGTITNLPSNTAILTLSGTANGWTLTNQDGDVLGATAAKKLEWNSGTTTWTITSDGVNSTNSAFGTIQYNGQQDRARFCNYTSKQTRIEIYRLGSSTPSVTIEFEGFPYRRTSCELPTYKAGSEFVIPSAVPEIEGKSLKAWKYGETEYAPGATFVVPEENVVFVPVWEGGQAVENTSVRTHATKTLRDGQLVIVRDGKEYNVIGTRIK